MKVYNFIKNQYKIIGILFIIVIIISLHFINVKKNKEHEKSTIKFEKIIREIKNNNEDIKKIRKYISKNQNIYGSLICLKISKKYEKLKQLKKSEEFLKKSLINIKDKDFKNILLFRIARLEIEQKHILKTKRTLKNIKNSGWEHILEEIKGDLYLLENKKEKALKHWKSSLNKSLDTISKEILKMKINYIKK